MDWIRGLDHLGLKGGRGWRHPSTLPVLCVLNLGEHKMKHVLFSPFCCICMCACEIRVCVCVLGLPLRLPPAGIIKHDLQSLISFTSCHLDQRVACWEELGWPLTYYLCVDCLKQCWGFWKWGCVSSTAWSMFWSYCTLKPCTKPLMF